jgi:hypothetical protein
MQFLDCIELYLIAVVCPISPDYCWVEVSGRVTILHYNEVRAMQSNELSANAAAAVEFCRSSRASNVTIRLLYTIFYIQNKYVLQSIPV